MIATSLTSQVFHSLADHSIQILQVAEAPFSLRVIIPASDLPEAITVLHNYVSGPICSPDEQGHSAAAMDLLHGEDKKPASKSKQKLQVDAASLKVLV